MKRITVILAGALVVAATLTAGTMDYTESREQDARYVEMVCAGHWGDYKSLEPECSE